MTSLLSAISGKFNASLVLGTVFPVTVFVILTRLVIPPLFPAALDLPFVKDNQIFTLTLIIVVLSGLFHHLNTAHIRFYEGYPWEKTALGRLRARSFRRQLAALTIRIAAYSSLAKTYRNSGEKTLEKKAKRARDAVRTRRNSYFPNSASSVLPTRLGNAIRSFENYPGRMYGIAAVPLWPRLVAKIDASYAQTIDGAKASFDFMLHSATLSGALALLLLGGSVARASGASREGAWFLSFFGVATLAGLSFWFYYQSVGRAVSWGNTVRGAFDLYRRPLLSALGYDYEPADAREEIEIWQDVSWRIDYAYDARKPYKPQPPRLLAPVRAASSGREALAVFRGVRPGSVAEEVIVVLEVSNLDTATATGVIVEDRVPGGFDLVAGSPVADRGSVTTEGANPFSFALSDPIASERKRVLEYRIRRRPETP